MPLTQSECLTSPQSSLSWLTLKSSRNLFKTLKSLFLSLLKEKWLRSEDTEVRWPKQNSWLSKTMDTISVSLTTVKPTSWLLTYSFGNKACQLRFSLRNLRKDIPLTQFSTMLKRKDSTQVRLSSITTSQLRSLSINTSHRESSSLHHTLILTTLSLPLKLKLLLKWAW